MDRRSAFLDGGCAANLFKLRARAAKRYPRCLRHGRTLARLRWGEPNRILRGGWGSFPLGSYFTKAVPEANARHIGKLQPELVTRQVRIG